MIYHRLLRSQLRTRDIARIRPAVNRWLMVTVAWQVLVLIGCGLYLVAFGSRHGRSPAWIAPPLGAAFGIGLPLQYVVMAIVRAVRESA